MTEYAQKILVVTSNYETENTVIQDTSNNIIQDTSNTTIEDTNNSKAETTFKDSAMQQKIKDTSITRPELIENKLTALCRPLNVKENMNELQRDQFKYQKVLKMRQNFRTLK